jgi:hypothetical protein
MYVDGFNESFSPPLNTYVIVYVTGLHVASTTLSPVAVFEILLGVHPANVYPLLLALAKLTTHCPYVYVLGFMSAFIPPFNTYVILYSFANHVAVNTFAHVLHFTMIFHPSHPLNVYPSFVGFFNWMKSSTVYVDGFGLFAPSTSTYVIGYAVASCHSATNVLFPVVHCAISVTFTPFNVHPENVYHSLLGSTNSIVGVSIV